MEIKDHVIDHRGYVLRGDSRGITVPWTLRKEVWTWSNENKIAVQYSSLKLQDLKYKVLLRCHKSPVSRIYMQR